jgi:hypothetical protein
VTLTDTQQTACIQTEDELRKRSSSESLGKLLNSRVRPKSKISAAESAPEDQQTPQEVHEATQHEIEVGPALIEILMLFSTEREGKQWMELMSGAAFIMSNAHDICVCSGC